MAAGNIEWVSLQKNAAKPLPVKFGAYEAGKHIDDVADAAAVISQLDLLISVDTAAVHVAGALNKPVWVMLSASPACFVRMSSLSRDRICSFASSVPSARRGRGACRIRRQGETEAIQTFNTLYNAISPQGAPRAAWGRSPAPGGGPERPVVFPETGGF